MTDNIKVSCVLDPEDSITFSRGVGTAVHVQSTEEGTTANVVVRYITDIARLIGALERTETEDRQTKIECALAPENDYIQLGEHRTIPDNEETVIVKVLQGEKYVTNFMRPEDAQAVANFLREFVGLSVPGKETPSPGGALLNEILAHNDRAKFEDDLDPRDLLLISTDPVHVGLTTVVDNEEATVYMKGEQVMLLIVELIRYTNESDTFDGKLQLSRTREIVEQETERII